MWQKIKKCKFVIIIMQPLRKLKRKSLLLDKVIEYGLDLNKYSKILKLKK